MRPSGNRPSLAAEDHSALVSTEQQRLQKGMPFVVAALYHFFDIPQHEEIVQPIRDFCTQRQIQGTLLIAAEGVNGTIAGSREDIDATLAFLRQIPELSMLEHKESRCDFPPFFRLKVKIRKEIVTMGIEGVRPKDRVGTYVDPEDWNELIARDDIVLIDARNDFEIRVGRFKNAVDPNTTSFTEFPTYVDENLAHNKATKVAMYCTGGIRCEKASSHLLAQGFDEVFHLKGGILKYLEKITEEQSLWEGECFVFDRRVSVGHGLEVGSYQLCHGCQSPLSKEQQEHRDFVFAVCCEYCAETLTPERRDALEMRKNQMLLAESRGENHLGMGEEDMYRRRKAKEEAKRAERERQGHPHKS